jgi:hypothetical protein
MDTIDSKKHLEFGRLLKVVSDITLESTNSFKIRDFFKTQDDGGIFNHVSIDTFHFHDEVINSPAKELARYKFSENIALKNIIRDAKKHNIYEEVDFAHIKQICERHIVAGEKILYEEYEVNSFWVRSKFNQLHEVIVILSFHGWSISALGYVSYGVRHRGSTFLRN